MRRYTLVIVLSAIIIAVVASLSWTTRSQAVMAGFQAMLETELTKALGNAVSVGAIEIESTTRVALNNIAIYGSDGQTLATSEKVAVAFSVFSILRGQPAVDAVSKVTLINPRVNLIQLADGRWNIEELIREKKPKSAEFSGLVEIQGGSADVRTGQGQWQFDDIRGKLDFGRQPSIKIQAGTSLNGSKFAISGTMNNKGEGVLTVRVDQIALESLNAFLPKKSQIKLTGGQAGQVEITFKRENSLLTYAGEAYIKGAGIDYQDITMRDGRGLITFTEKKIYLFQSAAKIQDQPITASGWIALGDQPVLDLKLESPGFDVSALQDGLPLKGAVAFTAAVKGTAANPLITGDIQLEGGLLNGYAVQRASATIKLIDEVLDIERLEAGILGGTVTGAGRVETASREYWLKLSGRNIDGAALTAVAPGLSGRGGFDFTVRGRGTAEMPAVSGLVSLEKGTIAAIPFNSLNSCFNYQAGRLTIDYLTVSAGQGLVSATGTVDGKSLNLAVQGQTVPLGLVAGAFNSKAADGAADFEGSVFGSPDAPRLKLKFTASQGQVLHQPFHTASGELEAGKDGITLTDVSLIDGLGSHRIEGSVAFSGSRALNLTILTRNVRAENIAKLLAPDLKLTGNVDNEVAISGTLDNPQAVGLVKLTEGSFRGYLLTRAVGGYKYAAGVAGLDNFVIDSLGNKAVVSGTVTISQEFNLDINAHDIELARLPLPFPYAVNGKVDFRGKLTGTAGAPVANGRLTADGISLNNQEVRSVLADLTVRGSAIDITNLTFLQGKGAFTAAGGIDINTKTMYGRLKVENGQLAPILTVMNLPGRNCEGEITGELIAGGTVARPTIWFTGGLKAGKVKGYPLGDIETDLTLNNNVLTVASFTARQGQGLLAMRGAVDLDGAVEMEIGARDLDGSFFTKIFESTVDTKGRLSFTAQVSGAVKNPHTAVSLEFADGSVANATFDKLYGLLIFEKGSIHVNQLLLTKGPYRASAYGVIPLAALNQAGRQKATLADQMDLKIRLDEANLSILPVMTKQVAWAEGQTKGELTVAGTLAQPLLYGSLTVADGSIKLASLASPIQKVGVDIRFEGDKININAFNGQMGGGSYRLTGTTAIRGMSLAGYDLQLIADKLGISHKNFKGPLNGTLRLTDNKTKPLLSGKFVFENLTVDIPPVAPSSGSSFDMDLDLEFIIGKKTRLFNPILYDMLVEGRVKVNGSILEPDVSGRIDAIRGAISYLRTQFTIKEASAAFTQFASFEPVIALTAETKLAQTTVTLNVSGPVSAMNVRLTSDPALTQQEILSLLTLRNRFYEKQASGGRDTSLGRDELVSMLDAGLQIRFVSELETILKDSLGLDEFRLVKGAFTADDNKIASNNEGYQIEIGKYITDRLMLSYTTGINKSQHSMAARYDLTRRISLTAEIDELNNRRFGVGMRFGF